MRRNTVFESIQQEAELLMRSLLCKAEHFEHLLLDIILMDTHAAAADLSAVQHDIIGLCTYAARIRIDILQILFHRHCERMMHRRVAVLLIGPLKQRELRNPEEVEFILVQKTKLTADLDTKCTECRIDCLVLRIGNKQEQIARLAVHRLDQCLHILIAHEFGEGGLHAAVLFQRDIGKTLCTVAAHELGQRIDLLAGHAALSFCIDAADAAALGDRVGKYAETAVSDDIGNVMQFHAETGIRLIGTEAVHRGLPCHALERNLDIKSQNLLEKRLQKPLIDIDDIVDIDKRKLHINLCEFRLTVRAKVLVAETSCQLEIAVIAGHHQELLVQLR